MSGAVPANRRAWHITDQGDLGSLRLVEEAMPQLTAPGQVLVEVQALGLNLADVFCCLGLYKAAPKGDFVPGLEFSGVVIAAAAEQDQPEPHHHHHHQQQQQQRYKPGDRVLGVLRFGAFATHVAIPAAYLRPIPADWSFEQAASYPVQTLTAAFGLYECGSFRPGQCVLVHSAAGGVGLQALQILARQQASVLGLVGSADKVQLLDSLYNSSSSGGQAQQAADAGAALPPQQQQQQQQQHMEFAVRVWGTSAIAEQLSGFLARAGRPGFDVTLDSLGGEYFKPSYAALNPCGRHVIFGAGSLTPKPGARLSLNPAVLLAAPASLLALVKLIWGWLQRPRLDVIAMPGDNKGVVGFNLIWLYDRLDLLADLYDKLDSLSLGPPLVGRTYDFAELPAALAYLQSGRSVGKVVVTLQQPSGSQATSAAATEQR
uniref:Enoyl reductase (ER) domain-containing protein n=1 Tax=Tetradesmus obliquus TaxID=3088 RepID=A0A383VHV9_TETOB|eukprot:jgi/Sobl393_1/5493/SZX64419.1